MVESIQSPDAEEELQARFYLMRHSFANYLGRTITSGDSLYYNDDLTESEAEVIPFDQAISVLRDSTLQTSAGVMLQDTMNGASIIDLACGHPGISVLLRYVANAYGARDYTGVDIDFPSAEQESVAYSSAEGFQIAFQQADILSYLRGLQPSSEKKVFCFFGLEPLQRDSEQAQQYAASCLAAIEKVTKPGDAIVVGMGTGNLFQPGKASFPPRYGFELTGSFVGPRPETRGRGQAITQLAIYRRR